MTIEQTVAEIKAKYFHTELSIGKVVVHPEHGKVVITSGCYWDPTYGRLSNWWSWKKVLAKRIGKRTYSGYGWM